MKEHVIASLSLVIALVFLANPFDFWMPSEFELVVAGLVAVIVFVYVGLVFKDEGRDEREEELRNSSARAGYLAGVAVLTISVIASLIFSREPNVWVLVALGAMVLSRLIARFRRG